MRALAACLVDPAYYVAHYADVARAGIDPVCHFAQNWHRSPIRSPSARAEPWIFVLSPVAALVLSLAGRDRADVLDCLRKRINDLSGEGRGLRLWFCLAVARLVARRTTRPAVAAGLGKRQPVVRVDTRRPDWIRLTPVAEAADFTFSDPLILLSDEPAVSRRITRPALWCAAIPDATVFGAAEVSARNTFVVHEPAADPALGYASRQCNFVTPCFPKRSQTVLARIPTVAARCLDQAVLLGGRGGENYFHFLIEYLTKGYIIEKLSELDGIPLLVSAELHPQEREALARVLPERPIVPRPTGARFDVSTLHVPSVMSFVPDDPSVPFWQASAVNGASLRWLRERVLAGCTPARDRADRIYLARTGARNIVNAEEVAAVFRRHGFTVIEPGRLSFAEQVETFQSATYIAGPVGAALSNLVFATPGSRVMGIISPFTVRFSMYASLARFAGCTYFAHPGVRSDYRPGLEDRRAALAVTHGSFHVDVTHLERALRAFLEKP